MWPFSKSKAKIIFDEDSNWAQQALKGSSIKIVNYIEDADLIWTRKINDDVYDNLLPLQLINHLRNEDSITDKGNLFTHLNQFDGTTLKRFIPQSFRLYVPSDLEAFLAQLPPTNEANEPWILKPTNLSKGRGIVIFNDYDEIRTFCQNPQQNLFNPQTHPDRLYMIQKYIKMLYSLKKENRK